MTKGLCRVQAGLRMSFDGAPELLVLLLLCFTGPMRVKSFKEPLHPLDSEWSFGLWIERWFFRFSAQLGGVGAR
ncbi:hypothetical protein C8F01DRAFT_1111214 [Mycena amicta]|nr:hypothetical protein C8F01DRAFT_1111214 [Mycena amicta]